MKRWIVVSKNDHLNEPALARGFFFTEEAAVENAEYGNLNHRGWDNHRYKAVEIDIPDSIWDDDDGDQRMEMGR